MKASTSFFEVTQLDEKWLLKYLNKLKTYSSWLMRLHLWYVQYNGEDNSTIANNLKCSRFTELFKLCYSLLYYMHVASNHRSTSYLWERIKPWFRSKVLKYLLNLHNYSLNLWVLWHSWEKPGRLNPILAV